jgi:hypothetical protein
MIRHHPIADLAQVSFGLSPQMIGEGLTKAEVGCRSGCHKSLSRTPCPPAAVFRHRLAAPPGSRSPSRQQSRRRAPALPQHVSNHVPGSTSGSSASSRSGPGDAGGRVESPPIMRHRTRWPLHRQFTGSRNPVARTVPPRGISRSFCPAPSCRSRAISRRNPIGLALPSQKTGSRQAPVGLRRELFPPGEKDPALRRNRVQPPVPASIQSIKSLGAAAHDLAPGFIR